MNEVLTNEDVSAIAADIARELRAYPDRWQKQRHGWAPGPRCLTGHILSRGHEIYGRVYYEFLKAAGTRQICEWNDEPSRTVLDVIVLCESIAGRGYGFARFRAATLSALDVTRP